MDFHTVFGNSMNYKHSPGFQHRHVPRTSAWSLVALWVTNTNTSLNCSGTKTQHGFHQGQDPQTSILLQVAA